MTTTHRLSSSVALPTGRRRASLSARVGRALSRLLLAGALATGTVGCAAETTVGVPIDTHQLEHFELEQGDVPDACACASTECLAEVFERFLGCGVSVHLMCDDGSRAAILPCPAEGHADVEIAEGLEVSPRPPADAFEDGPPATIPATVPGSGVDGPALPPATGIDDGPSTPGTVPAPGPGAPIQTAPVEPAGTFEAGAAPGTIRGPRRTPAGGFEHRLAVHG